MTSTLTLKLKIAFSTLLPPEVYCSVSQTPLDFFLSVTTYGCLVLPFVLLFVYVSNYDVTMQNAMFPAMSKGCRDVKENIIGIFLFKMCISIRYEKNNHVPMLNRHRHISVSGDIMSNSNLGYCLNWYLWHRITRDWDLSVSLWIQHWYMSGWIFLSGVRENQSQEWKNTIYTTERERQFILSPWRYKSTWSLMLDLFV